jgi:hypothetical protein
MKEMVSGLNPGKCVESNRLGAQKGATNFFAKFSDPRIKPYRYIQSGVFLTFKGNSPSTAFP